MTDDPIAVMVAAMRARVHDALRATDRHRAKQFPTDVPALAKVGLDALLAAGWTLTPPEAT